MRTAKLGSHILRLVTPTADTRYYAFSGWAKLRLFWIFRNFDMLSDRVLSPQQLRRVVELCARPGAELAPDAACHDDILGTLEQSPEGATFFRQMSALFTAQASAAASAERAPKPQRVSPDLAQSVSVVNARPLAVTAPRHSGRGFAFAAVGLVVVITIMTVAAAKHGTIATNSQPDARHVANHPVRPAPALVDALVTSENHPSAVQQLPLAPLAETSGSTSTTTASVVSRVVPDPTEPGTSLPATTATVESPAVANTSPDDISTSAATAAAPITSTLESASPASSSSGTPLAIARATAPPRPAPPPLTLELPPSAAMPSAGSPRSPLALPEFPRADQNSEIIVRAIVAADGRVTRVEVVSGSAALASAARRTVMNWRYSARAAAPEAESRIRFRVIGPDVVTVSFLRTTQ